MPLVAPSIISADFGCLKEQIQMVESAGADWIHIDVMDGQFVPNITIGAFIVEHIRRITDLPLDVHLMIQDPDRFIDSFRQAGADTITVHQEACRHLDRTLDYIRQTGAKAGVAINPATSPATIEYVLDSLDLALVMSVNPGFSGQKFIKGAIEKISVLRQMIGHRKILIEVDGGVTDVTGLNSIRAGADVLVSASYIFGAETPADHVARLKSLDASTQLV